MYIFSFLSFRLKSWDPPKSFQEQIFLKKKNFNIFKRNFIKHNFFFFKNSINFPKSLLPFRFLKNMCQIFKINYVAAKLFFFLSWQTYLLILIRFTTFTTMNLLAYDKVHHVIRYSYLIGCLPVFREAGTHSCSLKCRQISF